MMILSFVLFSCGSGPDQSGTNNNEASDNEKISQEDENSSDNEIKDCNDFLDSYEKWVDDYVDVVAAYMKDPTSIEIRQEYGELASTAATWPTEWTSYAMCAQSEDYQKRFDEITDKLDKKLEELGFD